MDQPIYLPSESGPLRQGELITGLNEGRANPEFQMVGRRQIEVIARPYLVALSQDCDLTQDYVKHTEDPTKERPLECILFGIALPFGEQISRITGSDIRKRIRQNKDERYHVLEATPPEADAKGDGLPSLLLDFRCFVTLPTEHVYWQTEPNRGALRRCRLVSPYLEHLQLRFAHFLARVALPREHIVGADGNA